MNYEAIDRTFFSNSRLNGIVILIFLLPCSVFKFDHPIKRARQWLMSSIQIFCFFIRISLVKNVLAFPSFLISLETGSFTSNGLFVECQLSMLILNAKESYLF